VPTCRRPVIVNEDRGRKITIRDIALALFMLVANGLIIGILVQAFLSAG